MQYLVHANELSDYELGSSACIGGINAWKLKREKFVEVLTGWEDF
jgi:hypothetical protein